jgi:hypothetical protein
VLIWPDAWARLPQADFQPGAKLTVRGEVNLYKGDLEIVTELPSDVEVLARAAPVAAQVKSIGSITPDDVKSLIVTQGAKPTLCVSAAGYLKVPTLVVRPVDTVGAGDAFAGAFAGFALSKTRLTPGIGRSNSRVSFPFFASTRRGSSS